jgi:hypothetical protein
MSISSPVSACTSTEVGCVLRRRCEIADNGEHTAEEIYLFTYIIILGGGTL